MEKPHITQNENFDTFISSDDNGDFKIEINRKCNQITIKTQIGKFDEEVFFDFDLMELKMIRQLFQNKISELESKKNGK
jgi:hypothetical protein